jgi:uncharacterized membrane protein YeaQ/YmgE (transglycosylase-associated protein family)
MKQKGIAIFILLVAVSLTGTTAQAQEPTPLPPTEFNPTPVAAGFATSAFWIALVATLAAGAVGGLVYELLILQGNLELPHKPTEVEATEKYPHAIVKNLYDLGIWARIIIGALAAVAALLVLAPRTTFGLLATAVVAGSAGTAIFRSLQERLTAAMAQKDAADTRAAAGQQSAKVDEALGAFTDLKKRLVGASTSPAGVRKLMFEGGAGVTLDLEELDKVERLLSEAKGMHARI